MSAATDHTPTPLSAALAYAWRGWRVIPIPPGQKHPAIAAWQREGTTDTDRITHWFTKAPDHGVGIVTGAESGLFVLDVDIAGDKAGDDTLAELEAAYGKLPDTLEVVTGSGGRHLYFAWPDVEIRNDAGRKLGPGLDIRGEGGQVLAPPTIHPNGQPYLFDATCTRDVNPAPAWLIGLLTQPEPTPEPQPQVQGPIGDRPGDLWAAQTTWAQLLEPDGWTLHHTGADGEQFWTRPGKDRRDGTSATVGYKGADVLKVFTSSVPSLAPEQTYSKLGYYAATRHQGDHTAAARALRAQGWCATDIGLGQLVPATTVTASEILDEHMPQPITWGEFWTHENGPEWLIEPIVPAARHVVLYAPAKAGKSLLALDIAAAAATGRNVLGYDPREPVSVVYLDLEMTEDDLRDRLEDMGYSNTVDLTNLHYYALPSLPPLDTPDGGHMVKRIAERHDARLVVIDTMARVVAGEENSADTYRQFDLWTSLPLKQRHTAVLRIDHAGKDLTKGQRGSSEKNGYADLVWKLTMTDTGDGTLTATHRRMGWAPQTVRIQRHDNPLAHVTDNDTALPEGALAVAAHLDELDADLDISVRKARELLREAGIGHRNDGRVGAALTYRRQHALDRLISPGHTSGHAIRSVPRSSDGARETKMPSDLHGARSGHAGHTPPAATGAHPVPIYRDGVAQPAEPPVWPHPQSTQNPPIRTDKPTPTQLADGFYAGTTDLWGNPLEDEPA